MESTCIARLGRAALLAGACSCLALRAAAFVVQETPVVRPVPLNERLQRDRAELRAGLAAMRALPWGETFYARLETLLEEPDVDWVPTSNGYYPGRVVRFELEWNRPAQTVPPGSDDVAAPDQDPVRDEGAADPPFRAIVDLQRQLARNGIEFLFVPVPTRAELYPELVFEEPPELGPDFPGLAAGNHRFLLRLSEQGVESVDLLSTFARERFAPAPAAPDVSGVSGVSGVPGASGASQELFLQCNSHWTPRGAALAAEVVAARLRQMPGPDYRELRPGVDVVYEAHVGINSFPRGASVPSGVQPELVNFERVLGPDLEPFPALDKESPVLVIGDSFVKYFDEQKASFAEHLAARLGRPVDVVSVAGGGALAARQLLARRRTNRVETKQVVVWLLTTSSLVDREEWTPIALFE